MYLSLVITSISIIIGLISVLIGIWISGRLAGKLRRAVIFLILAVIIFVVKEALKVFDFFIVGLDSLELVRDTATITIVLFILFATFSMKQMINSIDNHYKKK